MPRSWGKKTAGDCSALRSRSGCLRGDLEAGEVFVGEFLVGSSMLQEHVARGRPRPEGLDLNAQVQGLSMGKSFDQGEGELGRLGRVSLGLRVSSGGARHLKVGRMAAADDQP